MDRTIPYRQRESNLIGRILGFHHEEAPEDFSWLRALKPVYILFKAQQRRDYYFSQGRVPFRKRLELMGMAFAGVGMIFGYVAALFAGLKGLSYLAFRS